MTQDTVDRYREIIDEIKDLLSEANHIVRQSSSKLTKERAKRYCHAEIAVALDSDHDYLAGSMFTMEKIANELESQVEKEDDESEETH